MARFNTKARRHEEKPKTGRDSFESRPVYIGSVHELSRWSGLKQKLSLHVETLVGEDQLFYSDVRALSGR